MNTFIYSNTNKRYHTLDYFYKQKFGCKVSKISLNAGFSCPNLDGKVGYGGCIYCSKTGSGEHGGNPLDDLKTQFNKQKQIMDRKWPGSKYIAYFQARTNTYAPIEVLREKYEKVLKLPNVIGLTIATRCDAISEEVLDYLDELNKRTNLTIELGLQTIHEKTAKIINRCHTLEEFDEMVNKLRERKIEVVVHIINGLPYETEEMMLETVRHVNKLDIQGIKIHMLNIVKDTKLHELYMNKPFDMLKRDEYIDIVIRQLELLRKEIVIHRITADPDPDNLVEPKWLLAKRTLINDIDKEMVKRNTYQGIKA